MLLGSREHPSESLRVLERNGEKHHRSLPLGLAEWQANLTTVTPSVAHGVLPSVGWRLVRRIDPAQFMNTASGDFVRKAGIALLFASSVFLLAAVLFDPLYLRPIGSLASSAEHIADRHGEYPAN